MTFPTLNLPVIAPQIILVVGALLILVADLLVADKRILGWVSLVIVLGALAAVLTCRSASPAFQTMALQDGLALVASAAVLIAAALAILLSLERVADFTSRAGAYYALLLLAIAGMQAMAVASDLMTIFLALEIFSLALYILVGFNRRDVRSAEAALKYFLLGAFASGFLLYGMALIYAATGTTNLDAISQADSADVHVAAVCPAAPHRGGAAAGGLRLQGGAGAVPHVDARRVPGRADAGDRVHVGGDQDRGLRSADPRAGGAGQLRPALADRVGGAGRAHHDAGQPGRAAPDQPQAHVGLFQHRARGLPADRPGRGHCARRPGRALLPAGLHLHEPGRVRRAAGGAAPGRERRVRRAYVGAGSAGSRPWPR